MSELRLGTSPRRLDLEATRQGVELECPFRPGFFVTVLPFAVYNPHFREATQKHAGRLWNGKTKEDAPTNGEATDMIVERSEDPRFICEALVAGMRGLYDSEGSEVEYTQERGISVLSDAANADVLNWIVGEASNYGQFYTKEVEDAAGN